MPRLSLEDLGNPAGADASGVDGTVNPGSPSRALWVQPSLAVGCGLLVAGTEGAMCQEDLP